jgi:hypothetical protein
VKIGDKKLSEKMATRNSAELDKRWFSGQDDLPEIIAENVEASSFGRALNATLGKNGWDGKTAAGVGLELSSDNRAVKSGQFFLRGPLSGEQGQIQASKLWERAAADAVAIFKFPHGGEFDFSGGSLASEYLEGEAVKLAIERSGQQVPPEEWQQIGITPFSLRLIAYLDKLSNKNGPKVKFNLLFFPASREQMDELADAVQGPAWPGVKILEGHAALFPKAPQEGWGCPIYPILCTSTKFEAAPNLPASHEIRYAIAKIMATARLPVPCANQGTMRRKWAQIQADPEAYEERTPAVVWPLPAEARQRAGEKALSAQSLYTFGGG